MDTEKLEKARNLKLITMKFIVLFLLIVFAFFSYRMFMTDTNAIPSWFALTFLVMPLLSYLFVFFYKGWRTYFGGIAPTLFFGFWILVFHCLTTTMKISVNFIISMVIALALPLFVLSSLKYISKFLKKNLYEERLGCKFVPDVKKYGKFLAKKLEEQGLMNISKISVDNVFVSNLDDSSYTFAEFNTLFSDRMDLCPNDTSAFYGFCISADLKEDVEDVKLYVDAKVPEFKENILNMKLPVVEEYSQAMTIFSDKENSLINDDMKKALNDYNFSNNNYVIVIENKRIYCWLVAKQDLFEVSIFRPVQSSVDNYAMLTAQVIKNSLELLSIFKDLLKNNK